MSEEGICACCMVEAAQVLCRSIGEGFGNAKVDFFVGIRMVSSVGVSSVGRGRDGAARW